MSSAGYIDGGTVLGLEVAADFAALEVAGAAKVTDLRSDSPVTITGDDANLAGCSATYWTVAGNRARLSGCDGVFEFTGTGNSANGCTAHVPTALLYNGPTLMLAGDRNRWLAGTARYDGSGANGVVAVTGGDANGVIDTDVVGAAASEVMLDVSGATRTRIDRVHFEPEGAAITARIAAADGTVTPSETKEWGFGGVVVTGTSVILRAWRDLHLQRVVFVLRVAGGTDTDGNVLVNGVSAAAFTIPAAATTADVYLDLDLDLDDEVAIDITAAGTLAQDLSTQAEVLL